MEKTSYAPGDFCWTNLATSDWKAARQFYTSLFGWTSNEFPMGDQPPYVMLQKNGRDVCALYEDKSQHPSWLSYIAVVNVDNAVAKAKSLGAKLLQEAVDVGEFGRMATIQDPQSARFAVWEARKQKGAAVINEPGSMCWNELYTEEIEASRKFYSALFDWKLKISPEYTEAHLQDDTAVGGMFQITDEMRGTHPMWIPYFAVSDCDSTAAKATSSGGAIYVAPSDIANVGRFAVLADPQGAPFAIIRLTMTR